MVAETTTLSDQDLLKVMELVRGADSVELKPRSTRAPGPTPRGRSASIRSTHRCARCSSSTPPSLR